MGLDQISTIIIDDETDAIKLLVLYLRRYPNITISGTESDALMGLALVKEIQPDLVFLDIDSPGMNGLQVADSIFAEDLHAEIVFTTAHQQYAYDALGVNPLDFLTKPYGIEDIEIVISKYFSKIGKKKLDQKFEKFAQLKSYMPNLKLPVSHGFVIVDAKDIVYFQSHLGKTKIHLKDGTSEIINKTVHALFELLNPNLFFRLNRSCVINLNYLSKLDKKTSTCILSYNETIHTESISAEQITNLEKVDFLRLSEIS